MCRWAASSSARPAAPLEADPTFLLRHGHTYSGHATACAAGLEAMAITVREDLLERSKHVGARLADGLQRPGPTIALVAEVRGEGAVWAVAVHDDQDPRRCATACSTSASSPAPSAPTR